MERNYIRIMTKFEQIYRELTYEADTNTQSSH